MNKQPLRIGDAERDQAAASLGEHYAAGRLTKDEYDARAEQVWSARFRHDLEPVFADLPGPARPAVSATPAMARVPQQRSGAARAIWWVLPAMAMMFVAMAVVTGAPWLLFMLFWIGAIGGFGKRGGHGRYHEWRRHQQRLEHQWRYQHRPGEQSSDWRRT